MARKVKFRYEVLDLIDLVRERPCLWDRGAKDSKNAVVKERAWREICSFIDRDFEMLDEEEKASMVEAAIKKWRNVRDAFVRSLRLKPSDSHRKKYLYHDELQFLMRCIERDETESNITDESQPMDDEQELHDHRDRADVKPAIEMSDSDAPATGSSGRMKWKFASQNDAEEATKISPMSPPKMDEDDAFFVSITSTVRGLSSDEKLEFRMGVLSLIKCIKEKRKHT